MTNIDFDNMNQEMVDDLLLGLNDVVDYFLYGVVKALAYDYLSKPDLGITEEAISKTLEALTTLNNRVEYREDLKMSEYDTEMTHYLYESISVLSTMRKVNT